MDSAHSSTFKPNLTHTHRPTTTIFRRGIPLRRRKLPSLRLGGKKPRRGLFLVRLFRRVRVLRWLKLKHYSCMLKKLKNYYHSVVKDIIDGGGTLESFQQRLLLESSFAVPVMGISFSTFPSSYAYEL